MLVSALAATVVSALAASVVSALAATVVSALAASVVSAIAAHLLIALPQDVRVGEGSVEDEGLEQGGGVEGEEGVHVLAEPGQQAGPPVAPVTRGHGRLPGEYCPAGQIKHISLGIGLIIK